MTYIRNDIYLASKGSKRITLKDLLDGTNYVNTGLPHSYDDKGYVSALNNKGFASGAVIKFNNDTEDYAKCNSYGVFSISVSKNSYYLYFLAAPTGIEQGMPPTFNNNYWYIINGSTQGTVQGPNIIKPVGSRIIVEGHSYEYSLYCFSFAPGSSCKFNWRNWDTYEFRVLQGKGEDTSGGAQGTWEQLYEPNFNPRTKEYNNNTLKIIDPGDPNPSGPDEDYCRWQLFGSQLVKAS